MLFYYQSAKSKINEEVSAINASFAQEQEAQSAAFLDKQTDPVRLVQIAKSFNNSNPEMAKKAVMKAHELDPTSRDITLLASSYDSSLLGEVKTLDPLINR